MRAVIVHGTGGSPERNWFPWLSEKLGEVGVDIVIPRFPKPEQQTINSWEETFLHSVGNLTDKDILIGHSIGAAFVLQKLENIESKIRAAFLVCPFICQLGLVEFDQYNKTFVERDFQFDKIKMHSQYFKCYMGDNDPYVPLSLSVEVAKQLDCDFEVIKDGGHLNLESGYLSFSQILEDIKKCIA